jgi:hypothetical protein
MRSHNDSRYELWFTDGPQVAVVVTGATRETAGYIVPQAGGQWMTQVKGQEHALVFSDEHTAAEYVYRAHHTGGDAAEATHV